MVLFSSWNLRWTTKHERLHWIFISLTKTKSKCTSNIKKTKYTLTDSVEINRVSSNQVLLMKYTWLLDHQRGLAPTLQWQRLFASGKHSRAVPVFPVVDVPANLSQGQTVQCSEELQKTQELQLRLYSTRLACQILKFMTVQWDHWNGLHSRQISVPYRTFRMC